MYTVFRLTCLLLKVNSVTFEYVPGTLTSPAIPYQSSMSLVSRRPLVTTPVSFLFISWLHSFLSLPPQLFNSGSVFVAMRMSAIHPLFRPTAPAVSTARSTLLEYSLNSSTRWNHAAR